MGINTVDVPCLMDSSTCSGPTELNGAIVIHLTDRVRTSALVCPRAVLVVGVLFNAGFLSHGVSVIVASGILTRVVLKDKLLLLFLDMFSISLKGNV